MYQLQQVTKTYTRRGETITALDNSNMTISDNEFVAIVGPSGSGKTTLLSVLGGMMAPTSGDVLLDERTTVRGKKLGFVFQTFNLIPYLSACENVQVPLLLSGKSPDEQRKRALEMLERVGLADRVDHKPNELSQGQQQRVAMARTLANDPQIILADEPTGNLDSETRQQVMEYLTEFHKDGRTIVMVTHDRDSAAYAHRTIRLVNGVALDLKDAHAA
ncbi:UNVERIFIED_CONTAM: hypothetical protein GTU68_030193 [Idotea baltica]|nr:hypothetical protein [Idotea baltica]